MNKACFVIILELELSVEITVLVLLEPKKVIFYVMSLCWML